MQGSGWRGREGGREEGGVGGIRLVGGPWAACGVALMRINCTSPVEKAVSGVAVSVLQLKRYSNYSKGMRKVEKISRVSDQNGVSLLYTMLEIHEKKS